MLIKYEKGECRDGEASSTGAGQAGQRDEEETK